MCYGLFITKIIEWIKWPLSILHYARSKVNESILSLLNDQRIRIKVWLEYYTLD